MCKDLVARAQKAVGGAGESMSPEAAGDQVEHVRLTHVKSLISGYFQTIRVASDHGLAQYGAKVSCVLKKKNPKHKPKQPQTA